MNASSREFAAWSLPAGLVPPEGPRGSARVGDVLLRWPQADPAWVRGVGEALRRSRDALRKRTARDVAALAGAAGARFLDSTDPLRARALALLPPTAGLSAEMAEAVLDGMARDWTGERLGRLLGAEFANPAALDGFVPGGLGLARAVGPRLCVQIVAGSVPGVGATALLRSLLVKGPTLVKPGRGDVVLPVLLGDALRSLDPVVGDAVAVVYWPGGSDGLEDAALDEADVVTAYGSDAAVQELRARTPVTTRFVAYHHRVSLGVVGREALEDAHRHRTASEVAGAVAFFDQRGCVSPQLVFVEEGGDASAQDFAREVAVAMEAVERHLPGGLLDPEEASVRHQVRGAAELQAAAGMGVEIHDGGAAGWTVIYDPGQDFGPTCVGRLVRVKPVADVLDLPRLVSPLGRHLQTVAVAGCGTRLERLAGALTEVGVSRVAGFDAAPFPAPWWHHDGQGPLRALVRWADLEAG
ncbi:MAG TPA: acyl-CoA reductase [Longimicrobiales bacterium]|nr:acyl-CoA reductase [Longimicrobiales bacterium]